MHSRDFSIEPFKSRKHDFRSDKGKKHSYPKTRTKWNPSRICQRQSKTNLTINETKAHDKDMSRKFVGTPSMREYWRNKKAEWRAKEKAEGK